MVSRAAPAGPDWAGRRRGGDLVADRGERLAHRVEVVADETDADALLARIHRTYPELHALVHSGKKLPPEALERLRELAAETLKNL